MRSFFFDSVPFFSLHLRERPPHLLSTPPSPQPLPTPVPRTAASCDGSASATPSLARRRSAPPRAPPMRRCGTPRWARRPTGACHLPDARLRRCQRWAHDRRRAGAQRRHLRRPTRPSRPAPCPSHANGRWRRSGRAPLPPLGSPQAVHHRPCYRRRAPCPRHARAAGHHQLRRAQGGREGKEPAPGRRGARPSPTPVAARVDARAPRVPAAATPQ